MAGARKGKVMGDRSGARAREAPAGAVRLNCVFFVLQKINIKSRAEFICPCMLVREAH